MERPKVVIQILKAGTLYFALVFGAGFLLGSLRVLWVVPRFGERTAELMETPLMLIVSFLAARWVARQPAVPATTSGRLGIGLVALALLLVAEFSVVLWLRGLTINQYIASRDPVAGSAYIVSLTIFAVLPLLVSGK